uniref:Mucin 13b, cell surface associated n=1 Tax=Hucho hucho TaxID=62062 RepID=A0A4W5JQ96_9TELE
MFSAPTNAPAMKDPVATPTTKDPAATPTTEDPASTPTTEDPAATPTTEDPAATPATKDPVATPTTKDPAETPTTKDLAETPTTKDPAETPTTKDLAATPTTKDPSATPTTKDPSATPTTKDPAATPTTKDPAATPTTKDPAATPTTKDPVATTEGPTATTPTEASTTSSKPDPCVSHPCKGGSSCQPGYGSHFTCLCLAGQRYSETRRQCEEAQVFPGSLLLPKMPFEEDMTDPQSNIFNVTAADLTTLMGKILGTQAGYIDSTVLKLSKMPGGSARTFWSQPGGVNVTMENNFELDSIIEEGHIKAKIQGAINVCAKTGALCLDDLLNSATYEETDLCHLYRKPCEDATTTCKSSNGRPECTCQDNYVKSEYSIRTCKACESGKKAVNGVCIDCSFGYSGLNCNESWKLTLVIVGTVLGALLLITLIMLPVVARKTSKKSSSKKSSRNAEVPTYTSPYPTKDFRASTLTNGGVTNASSGFAGVPKIPRAVPNNNSWDRGSNLEMTESGSRQALVTKGDKGGIGGYQNPDDTRNFNDRKPYQSGGQGNNPYQSAGQGNNPYQSGGQGNNPYQSGGQGNNPYQSGGQGNNPYQSRLQDNNPYQSRG